MTTSSSTVTVGDRMAFEPIVIRVDATLTEAPPETAAAGSKA